MKKLILTVTLMTFHLFGQVVMEEVGVLSEELQKAGNNFKNYKFEKCLENLNKLLPTLEEWEKGGRLQESDELLYKKALELRAVSYYHLGKEQNSRDDFMKLIKLDPNYNLEATSSTKILRVFNSTRDGICGTLLLDVEPEDAEVEIDGKIYNIRFNDILKLMEGIHIIKISQAGYDSYSKEIQISAGESISEIVGLKPNARKVHFFLTPQGAKLFIDGHFAGSADLPADNKDEWNLYVSKSGFDPSRFFVIEALYLSPGNHVVEVIAPCHAGKKFSLPISLDAVKNSPGYVKPIELQKETLSLKINSCPKNAVVEIDGQKAGLTPLEIKDFCSGEHLFRIYKEGQGEYRQRHEFRGIDSYELEAKLRPTLLWAGVTKDQDVSADSLELFDEGIKANLPKIRSFNVTFSEELNPFLPETFYTKGVSDKEQEKVIKSLCSKYKTEGLLVAKLFYEGEKVMVSLRLFVPGIAGFDEIASPGLDFKDPTFLLKKLDLETNRSTDIVFHDDGGQGLQVLRAGSCPVSLKAGDRVLKIGNSEPLDNKSALAAIEEGGGNQVITVQKGIEITALNLEKMQQASFFKTDPFGNHKEWLIFNQEIISSEDEMSLSISKLNLARVEINLGRHAEALEILKELSFPERLSCLVPTQKYLTALSLLNSGNIIGAKEELKLLTVNKDAYLGTDGRILLYPLVSDLLNQMEKAK